MYIELSPQKVGFISRLHEHPNNTSSTSPTMANLTNSSDSFSQNIFLKRQPLCATDHIISDMPYIALPTPPSPTDSSTCPSMEEPRNTSLTSGPVANIAQPWRSSRRPPKLWTSDCESWFTTSPLEKSVLHSRDSHTKEIHPDIQAMISDCFPTKPKVSIGDDSRVGSEQVKPSPARTLKERREVSKSIIRSLNATEAELLVRMEPKSKRNLSQEDSKAVVRALNVAGAELLEVEAKSKTTTALIRVAVSRTLLEILFEIWSFLFFLLISLPQHLLNNIALLVPAPFNFRTKQSRNSKLKYLKLDTRSRSRSNRSSDGCARCDICDGCWYCTACIQCYMCRFCEECSACKGCEWCTGCVDCENCVNCVGCVGLKGARGVTGGKT